MSCFLTLHRIKHDPQFPYSKLMKNALKLILVLLVLPGWLLAELVPHALFSDHCVLQRGGPVAVWGQAKPGETVTVHFRGNSVAAETSKTGHWQVNLPVGEAGGPFDLIFETETSEIVRGDVWVGEVWLASGQSNMERQLGPRRGQKPIDGGMAAAAQADLPRLRTFNVAQSASGEPVDNVAGQWLVCSPEAANEFSAVGFFFGRDLLANLDVPVGIIHSSWGGTPAQAWTSEEVVRDFPEYSDILDAWEAIDNDESVAKAEHLGELLEWIGTMDSLGPELEDSDEIFDPEQTIEVPQAWEAIGYEAFDGIMWLRRIFELPDGWDGLPSELSLGPVDDVDTTWLNGRKLGSTMGARTMRTYSVPADYLKAGKNELLVRVFDQRGGGGIWDTKSPPQLTASGIDGPSYALAGNWEMRISFDMRDATKPLPKRNYPRFKNSPATLYNSMIAPLIPYGMRGVIWYQGESNSGDPEGYSELFPAMIEDWRNRWGLGDFPFLFVQIAPFERMPPEIREAQLRALEMTRQTAMVVTTDIGDADDIHPSNKAPVGERLALAARALAYNEPVIYSGPLYEGVDFEDGRAMVSFASVGPGLVAGDGEPLRGFTIAGKDRVFHPARAEIVGEQVVVSSPKVLEPAVVRYGWANVPDVNLFNRAGLPASPFRTEMD